MISAFEIEELLKAEANEAQLKVLIRFFKTGKGEYGEGDQFLGLKVPQTRTIVKHAKLQVDIENIEQLLYSPFHEIRLCGLLLLVEEMKANLPKMKDSAEKLKSKELKRKEIASFYIQHSRQVNNWDLVDLSCEYILGPFIRLGNDSAFDILYALAESDNLWQQRISIVTTLDFIRHDIFMPTLRICDILIDHDHDLIHKAIGWMLREIGKRDKSILTDYLEENYKRLSRTALRYSIEKFPESERQYWLKRR